MKPNVAVLLLVTGCLVTCPCAFADEILVSRIDEIRRTHNIAATALIITSKTQTVAEHYLGQPNRDETAPLQAKHRFRVGSITKAFTALAILRLSEMNKLRLDASVDQYLDPPPFINPWAETHPITVAQLLEHTAGFHDLSKKEFDSEKPLSIADAFALDPRSRVVAWLPGLYSSYSNSGAGVASAIIEKQSGMSYEDYVVDRVFKPLGMNSASFSIDHDFHPALVRGYDTDGVTEIPYWHTLYRAFGGADLAPRDMAPFLRVLLNNGQHHRSAIFLPQSIKRMHHPHTSLAARAGLTYGYGLGIYQYQRNGFSFFGHGGDADGYLSFFAHSPQLGLGYFVTMNAFNNRALKAMRVEIERYLIGDNQPAELSEVSLDHEHLQSLTGQYQPITQRFRRKQPSRARRVIVNAGSLVVTRPDLQPLVLVPVTKWLFRQPHETVATAVFVRCGEAHVLQSDIGNFAQIPETPGTANRPCVYADTTHRTPVPPIPQ